jgi:hypothetical protein
VNLTLARDHARSLLARYGLEGWLVQFDDEPGHTGLCTPASRTITLSARMVADARDERDLLDTILHEIAHALTPGHGHDRAWREKLAELVEAACFG